MTNRAFHFELPESLNATSPPERRGIRRDHVRLMVLDRQTGALTHSRFDHLERFLRPGDLLVLNNSRTLPAVLQAVGPDGLPVEIRLAHRRGAETWLALLVCPLSLPTGAELSLPEGLSATVANHPDSTQPLRLIRFSRSGPALFDTLYRIGQPVRYEYTAEPWDLEYYQTVFASSPGSVEMPSAGRAFSWEVLLGLQRQGIGLAYLSLHAGLSWYLADGQPKDPRDTPEEFTLPAETAAAVAETRRQGGRVIAVGTTVVRALESAADSTGQLRTLSGWAGAYIDRRYQLKVVDGLLTGLHEPEASHLDMLSAFMEPALLRQAYGEAVAKGYLWHEFGDTNLII